MILTNGQSNILVELTAPLLTDMAAGVNARDTLAAFYESYLGSTRQHFGKIHVGGTRRVIRELWGNWPMMRDDASCFCVEHDPAHCIYKEGSQSACNLWLRIDAVITLSNSAEGGDTARRDRSLWTLERKLYVPPEDVTPLNAELNWELRERAIRSLQDSGLLLPGLRSMAGTLRGLASRHGGGRMLLELGNESVPLGLTATILTEAKVETGEFRDVHYAYSLLWAVQELLRGLEAVGSGKMSVDQGAELVRQMGWILTFVAIVYLYMDGLPVIKQLNLLDDLPRGVELAVEVMSSVSKAAEPLLLDSRLELEPQWVDLEDAAKGAQSVAEYAEQCIIPQIVERSVVHLDQLLSMAMDFSPEPIAVSKESISKEGRN